MTPPPDEVFLPLSGLGVRVVLAGTGRHGPGSELPDIAQVERSLRDLREVLVRHCGVPDGGPGLTTVLDPADPVLLGEAITTAAEQATEVFLLHYVGHGVISPGGELHLATRATDSLSTGLSYKALPYSAVRDAVSRCRAPMVAILLDCCFSGRERGSFAPATAGALELAAIHGTHLLASAAREERSLALPGQPHTAFTGALIELLNQGDPTGPRQLTLDHAYRYLGRVLPERSAPRPHRHFADRGGEMVLAVNPAAPATPPPPSVPLGEAPQATCPYPGLRHFGSDDAGFFFGRAGMTAQLLEHVVGRLAAPGMVALLGASGSGKSSLLRAGLLPALSRGEERTRGWPRLLITPGKHPLEALTGTLRRAAQAAATGEERLGPVDAALLLREADGPTAGRRILLVVDQFEEVFTECAEESERRAFLDTLDELTRPRPDGGEPVAIVVLGVRADFYPHLLRYGLFTDARRIAQLPVRPMEDADLRAAVEGPARAIGLPLEDGLLDLLLHDLSAGATGQETDAPEAGQGARQAEGPTERAGALPFLSYALQATWQLTDGRALTLSAYRATGGIWGAVRQRADEALAQLDPGAREAARTVLLRMIRLGEGTQDTHHPVDLTELRREESAPDGEAVDRAVDALVRARIVTVDQEQARISHEALLRGWPALRQWIREDREELLARQRLHDDAAAWTRDGDRDRLYDGERLRNALRLTGRRPGAQQETAVGRFLNDSQVQSRRNTRRRQLRRTALILLTVASLLLGGVALVNADHARGAAREAQSRALSAQSGESASRGDGRLAEAQAISAWQVSHTLEARSAVLTAQTYGYGGTLAGHDAAISEVAVSPDGRTIATGQGNGTVRIFDAATHRMLWQVPQVSGALLGLAFSRDDTLLTASYDQQGDTGGTRAWNVRTREGAGTLTGAAGRLAVSPDKDWFVVAAPTAAQLFTSDGRRAAVFELPADTADRAGLSTAAISPDGRTLAGVGHAASGLSLWDLATAEQAFLATGRTQAGHLRDRLPLSGATGQENTVAFDRRGDRIAVGGSDGSVHVWNTADWRQPCGPRSINDAMVNQLAFSPDGSLLAAATAVGISTLWTDTCRNTGGPQFPGYSQVTALAFSPDGRFLVSGMWEPHTVNIWRTAPKFFVGNTGSNWLAYRPDGRAIAVAGNMDARGRGGDGLRVMDPASAGGFRQLDAGATTLATAYSPDGSLLAGGDADHAVRLWDASSGRLRTTLTATGPAGGDGRQVWSVAFSPDGRTLAAVLCHYYQRPGEPVIFDYLVLWDTATGAQRAAWQLDNSSPATKVAFAGRGGPLVVSGTGGNSHKVELRDADDGRFLSVLTEGDRGVTALAIAPDGRTAALGPHDGAVRLWDLTTRRPIGGPILGHTDSVWRMAFSPDGRTLATVVGTNDALRLWDVATGRALAVVKPDLGVLGGLAFAPDGRHLAVSGGAGAVAVLDIAPGRVVATLCQALRGASSTTDSVTPSPRC